MAKKEITISDEPQSVGFAREKYGDRMRGTKLNGVSPMSGETIQDKVRRAKRQDEPIRDVAEIIYTARSAGVVFGHDIRSDKWAVRAASKNTIDVNKLEERQIAMYTALGLNPDGTSKVPEGN